MSHDLTDWLVTHYGQEKMNPGLDRVREMLKDLLPILSQKKIITLAGTNGKGETTLWLSQYLNSRPHCSWISPHIERITERFVSEEGEIKEEVLRELIQRCHQMAQKKKISLSFYEFLFFVFCTWATERKVEILLLEVGLGGRLDAVNVLDADYLLLPSISRDHQEFLGNRYDQILAEKLALLRKKTTLISYVHLQYLRELVAIHVSSAGCLWVDLEKEKKFRSFEFSARNQLLAYAAFKLLQGHSLEIKGWRPSERSLEHRGEVWQNNGEWVFFGSHNPDGLRKLIQFLHSGNYTFGRPPFDAVIIAFSQRSEKDLKAMLKMVHEARLGKIIVTTFKHPKAASISLMKNLAREEGLSFVEDIGSLVQGKNKQSILVTGSYYFLGDFKQRFSSFR